MLVIYHDIVRFDVAMHYTHRMAIVERLQELVQVVPHVVVGQRLVQLLKPQENSNQY